MILFHICFPINFNSVFLRLSVGSFPINQPIRYWWIILFAPFQIAFSSLEKQGCFQPSVFRWEARNIRWASRANKAADQFVVCETIWMLISLRSLGLYMIHEKKIIIINNLNKLIFRTLICSTPYVAATGAQEKHSLQSITPHIHSLKQRYSEHTQGGRLFSFVYVCLP